MERYIIVYKDSTAFNTKWFDVENNWNEEIYMVIDLADNIYMIDGKEWKEIIEDNL